MHAGAIAPAPEHAAAKGEHIRIFFFWSEKKGGSSAPSEPPLATCLALSSAIAQLPIDLTLSGMSTMPSQPSDRGLVACL